MQSVDVTPSWRGIMPALIAALQAGTAEGQAIAREELGRLAAAVDAANQSGRDAAARAEREAEERAADLARAMQAAGFDWNADDAHSAVYDAEQTAKLFCRIANAWPSPLPG